MKHQLPQDSNDDIFGCDFHFEVNPKIFEIDKMKIGCIVSPVPVFLWN